MVKTKKKKFRICKDGFCANTRTIKHRKKIRNTYDSRTKMIYYFYDLESRILRKVSVATYNKFKHKKGFLLGIEYRYLINNFPWESRIHKMFSSFMFFTKYSRKQINADKSWAEDSGISYETPFAFGVSRCEDLVKKCDIEVKNESKKIDTARFKKYINYIEKELNKIDPSVFDKFPMYVDTYENLLDKYYSQFKWKLDF